MNQSATARAVGYAIGIDAAIDAIMSGDNVFITGGGGTGKSHIINSVREFFGDDSLFLAPTGLAALNIKGMSCHKAMGLSMGVTQEKDLRSVRSNKQAALLTSKAISRIIIDEVSMVRSDKFYEMDMKLRYFRKVDKPFGGLQVVVLGDGFQIAPVLTRAEEMIFREIYGAEIPFGSWSWMECNFRNVLLLKGHRQADAEFLGILNDIRMGRNLDNAVAYINAKCYGKGPDVDAVTLCSTNKGADKLNQDMYDSLPGTERVYEAVIRGDFKDRPVPEKMKLKVGVKVMITANDSSTPCEYVNGTVGYVSAMSPFMVTVDVKGKSVEVPTKIWENIEYEIEPVLDDNGKPSLDEQGKPIEVVKEKKLGSYTALPLKLGYAITTHKAQGLTLGAVNIDLGAAGAFTPGQAYVALSRASTVEGLRMLRQLRKRDIIVDSRIVSFYHHTFPNL